MAMNCYEFFEITCFYLTSLLGDYQNKREGENIPLSLAKRSAKLAFTVLVALTVRNERDNIVQVSNIWNFRLIALRLYRVILCGS